MTPNSQPRWHTVAICVVLCVLTWLVFGQTLRHDFVNYDDPSYVHEQPQIVAGLTLAGLKWALTSKHSGNWHPLTSLSHMLDCELFGLNPRGHHFTSVLLHTCAAVLLFLVLRQITGSIWRSAFVAAVFAIHPLRVESVAWVAERKDVLSGVLFMATLGAYAWYARAPSLLRYALVTAAFACALMSKPMAVTIPLVLLLLDYWPLARATRLSRLVIEKLPFLAMSAAASLITLQMQTATMSTLEKLPLSMRLGNAVSAAAIYVGQFFWPAKLAVFYPHQRDELPGWTIGLSAILLFLVSIGAVFLVRSRRYLPVGWFWFLVMLVPVIGIVQVGLQGHADRYTYLPHIGLAVLVTWGVADVAARCRMPSWLLCCFAAVALLALGWRASAQTQHWRDSETLWRHALAVTTRNAVAHTNLGNLLPAAEALPHYEKAMAIDPDAVLPLNNLAWILATSPEPSIRDGARAVELSKRAAELSGGSDAVYLRTLAAAYAEAGRFQDAISIAQHALPLAQEQGNAALANDLRHNIENFRRRIPVRDASLLPPPETPAPAR